MTQSASYPPPDTFLLELMDQVNLAFPHCFRAAKVHFKCIEQEPLRVGLTNLEATPHQIPVEKVELGHDETEILDTLNAIVGDLAISVKQHGQLFIEEGYWDIFPDEIHGGINAFLVEEKDQEKIIRMKRTFDKSELGWLLFTPEFYNTFKPNLDAVSSMRNAISTRLSDVQKYELDLQKGHIRFETKAGDVSFSVALLGSWLEETRGFLWAWANPNSPPQITTGIQKFKEAHQTPGLRLFYKPEFGAPESMGHQLCEYAATYLKYDGVYKAPFKGEQGPGFMYLGLYASKEM
jgi:hypothetical protein